MTKSVREKINELPVISEKDLEEINVVMKMSFEEIEYLLGFLKKQDFAKWEFLDLFFIVWHFEFGRPFEKK